MTERALRSAKAEHYLQLAKTAVSENNHTALRDIQSAVSSEVWTAIAVDCMLAAVKYSTPSIINVLIGAAGRNANSYRWTYWLYYSVRYNTHNAIKSIFEKMPRRVHPLHLQNTVLRKDRETVQMFLPWCGNASRSAVANDAVRAMQDVLPQLLEHCEDISAMSTNPSFDIMTQIYYRGKAPRPDEQMLFRSTAYAKAQKLAQERVLELALIFVALPAYVLLEICRKFNFWRLIGPTQEKRAVQLFQRVRDTTASHKNKRLKVQ